MKTNNNILIWLDYVAIAIIVIAFFVISYCGFFSGDDIWMNYGVSTLYDVIEHTRMFYLTYGGRLFSVASQYLFCGVLGNNKIWFDIVNTLFFVLLIMTCGRLIEDSKEKFIFRVLLFALLFWFLCPAPGESLFWVAGSTTYLWANSLTFVFLLLFQNYKDDSFSVIAKLGLFIMSIFAATEFITCASICGAFVVYYIFHIKEFKGNVVPFVVGFAIGSIILLFAPGNFVRVAQDIGVQSIFDISNLLHNPFHEIVKYKVLWMLLVVLILGRINNKWAFKEWVRNNSVLLLSLGWSIISFSLVFRPENRALFFTETLSLLLFLRFLYNYGITRIWFVNEFLKRHLSIVKNAIVILLYVIFMVDSVFAIVETKNMRDNNDKYIKEIVDSGSVAWDRSPSSHRMAYISYFHKFSNEALADKYGLDSIRVYPFYCQEKYYKNEFPFDNVYIDDRLIDGTGIFEKKNIRMMVVRIKNEELQKPNNHVVFTIEYTRPRKWYKAWLDKWRNYQYDRTIVDERDHPDICFEGYSYYIFWLKQENAKNLKSVKYDVE